MSSPLQNNITNLRELLEKVNSLPEAGEGNVLPELSNPADASKVLSEYEFINEQGGKVTGTIPSKSQTTYTPGTSNQIINAGIYLAGVQTILGDANLISENIKSGISIFGVSGSIVTEEEKLPVLNAGYPQDVSTTVIKGNITSAIFSVDISEHGNPAVYTYQWYVDGNVVSGATSATYTKTDLSTSATHSIYCKVTNAAGSVNSRIATLNVTQVYTPVLNSSYPQDATVVLGNSITSNVIVSIAGNPASYTYQWYKNDVAVSGATNSSYNFTPSSLGTTSIYCKVTNSAGTVISRTATISVNETYLYQNGDINIITGGFKAYAYRPSIHDEGTLSKPTVRINSDSIELEAYGYDGGDHNTNNTGSYFTVNAIDLTNVSKISVNMLDWGSQGDDYRTDIRLVVTPSVQNNYELSAYMSVKAIGTVTLSTTSLSGMYHIGFYLTGKTTKKIKFNELKLLR